MGLFKRRIIMYQENYAVLKKLIEEDGVIIPVARHRKPDGQMDRELNLNSFI